MQVSSFCSERNGGGGVQLIGRGRIGHKHEWLGVASGVDDHIRLRQQGTFRVISNIDLRELEAAALDDLHRL